MPVCTRFHFRPLSYLVWSGVLLSLPCYQKVVRSQDDPFAPEPRTATLHILVVDPEGRPIPNAMFQEELSLSFDQMAESPISVATDASGVLKVSREKRLDWGIWGSFYSPGFAIAIHYASSLDSPRRRKVKLVPEDAIAVQVFDEYGLAESNALVAPSLWIRNPLVNPHRTMHRRTDANGNASLLGSKKQELKAVHVEMPNHSGRDYLIPKSWDKETPLQLKWSAFQSSLDVKVVDSMGNAVPKVAVLVKSKDEDANENVIAEPTVVYWRRAWSDENGICHFHDISTKEVEVVIGFLSFHLHGLNPHSQLVTLNANRTSSITIKKPDLNLVSVSMFREDGNAPPRQVILDFRSKEGGYTIAIAEEDGNAAVMLEAGNWTCSTDGLGLPQGFLQDETTLYVVDGKETQSFPPMMMTQGQIISGVIEDLDVEKFESNVVGIKVSTGIPISIMWLSGKFESDGRFEITVPNDVDDEDVLMFRVPGTELQINQRSPWKLSPVLETVPDN